MMRYIPVFFKVMGVVFLILGFATAVGSLARWQFGGGVAWLFVAHAGMYALLGVGFFMRARWLLVALLLNLTGTAGLYLAAWQLEGQIDPLRIFISLSLISLVLGAVYASRARLVETSQARLVGLGFLLLWIPSHLFTLLRMLG